jgi:hypothetical protein
MNFARAMRIIWIDARLGAGDLLRRSDIMKAFGIGKPQASDDLKIYKTLFPGRITYDMSSKGYTQDDKSSPIRLDDRADVLQAVYVINKILAEMEPEK